MYAFEYFQNFLNSNILIFISFFIILDNFVCFTLFRFIMAKEQIQKKDVKKKPAKTLLEKRKEKQEKKQNKK